MPYRPLIIGALLWIVGTVAIRLGGQGLLHPNRPAATLILYLASFGLMALTSAVNVRPGNASTVTCAGSPVCTFDSACCGR